MLKFRWSCLALISILMLAGTAWSEDLCAEPVKTASGLVKGKPGEDGKTCSWKGIPFAAPPVGELRFRAPQPAPAWSGVREAFEYGHVCMQMLAGSEVKKSMSEDCLYLNVWRPEKSGVFPVMLWIHGGGYIMGSGGKSGATGVSFDGTRLVEAGDVVVVTINYRLHAFGFLADAALRDEDPNHSTGNYGSLDQVAAIRWVHDNIAAFGGDPANVTIFGQSAGGWSICTMLATPLNQGLFQRAILESGGCSKSEDLDQGYDRAKVIAKRVGCAPSDLACLRRAPAKKFLGGLGDLYQEGMAYGPHHDGYLLTGTPLAMIREGHYHAVPLLAGSTRNEVDAVLFFRTSLWRALPSQYERRAQRNLALTDEQAGRLTKLYPLDQFGNKPKKAFGRIFTDASLACPTYLGLAAAAERQKDAYLYRFDYDDNKYGKRLGALHAMEVPFVFNTVEGSKAYQEHLPEARELVRVIQGYWTNFAKTGDPNGPGLPVWPKFDPQNQSRQVLDTQIKTEPAQMQDRCSFWDDYLQHHPGFEETLAGPPEK